MQNLRGTFRILSFVFLASVVSVGCNKRQAPKVPELRLNPPPIGRPRFKKPVRKSQYLMVKSADSLVKKSGTDFFASDLLENPPVPMMVDRDFTTNSRTPDNSEFIDSKAQVVKPYRSFIEIQRYEVENNGENPERHPISNIKLTITFPKDPADKEKEPMKVELPGNGQYWPIGNGQVQEINRTFEVPWKYVQNDGFRFEIQMVRKGSWMKPCKFEVAQLSEFNRAYVCRTDTDWQKKRGIPEERWDKEGVQIRVFSDKNTPKRKVPKNAIAIR